MDLGIAGLTWKKTIGQGGFGVVHLAHDEAHGRDVAVKVLSLTADEAVRRRFDRERRAMGSLSSHPNIVTVFSSGYTEADQPYLVMELVEDGSLADQLDDSATNSPMDWQVVREMALGLTDALEATHQAGIVHCDIKPANILVGKHNRPMLTDFGIAAMAADESMRMTVSATPAYAAPELIQGREVDEGCDLYSLAATLYTCLDGGAPYGDTTSGLLGVLASIVSDPVPIISNSDVPDGFKELLSDAMAKEPSERISLTEFRARLEAVSNFDVGPASALGLPGGTAVLDADLSAESGLGVQPPSAMPPGVPGPRQAVTSGGSVSGNSGPDYLLPGQPGTAQKQPRRWIYTGLAAATIAILGLLGIWKVVGGSDGENPELEAAAGLDDSDLDNSDLVNSDDDGAGATSSSTVPSSQSVSTTQTTLKTTQTTKPSEVITPSEALPDVAGLTIGDAMKKLADAGVKPIVGSFCASGVARGTEPMAGTLVGPGEVLQRGSSVALVYDACLVPDLIGLRLDAVIEIAETTDGISVSWANYCDDVVLGTEPATGEPVAFDASILLELTPCD